MLPNESDTRPATAAEIAAFERGEQERWRCPRCMYVVELLSCLAVACEECRVERRALVWMERL